MDGELQYPRRIFTGKNQKTIDVIVEHGCRCIAEFGVAQGATSIEIARYLNGEGELHLFDFEDAIERVLERIHGEGFTNVIGHGCSRKTFDSYNWPLSNLLLKHSEPIYDYAFIDGSHTWWVDALTFFLVDRLLKPGGFVDFDDYNWSLAKSRALRPSRFPKTLEQYTAEQIADQQVKRVVDLLVRRDDRYREIVPDKVFRKAG
jgi:predicted O-methyltransferase YrrM